jgi:hypothetical protein
MSEQRMKTAIAALRLTLGLVILSEAVMFVMQSAGRDFAKTHLPDMANAKILIGTNSQRAIRICWFGRTASWGATIARRR